MKYIYDVSFIWDLTYGKFKSNYQFYSLILEPNKVSIYLILTSDVLLNEIDVKELTFKEITNKIFKYSDFKYHRNILEEQSNETYTV